MVNKPGEAGSVVSTAAARLVVPIHNSNAGRDAVQSHGRHRAGASLTRPGSEPAALHLVVPKSASGARPVQERKPVQAGDVKLATFTGLPVAVGDLRAVRDAVRWGGSGHAEERRHSTRELHAGRGGEVARLAGVVPHQPGPARAVREHDLVDAADVHEAARAGLIVVVRKVGA